jgi:hypothetical protein
MRRHAPQVERQVEHRREVVAGADRDHAQRGLAARGRRNAVDHLVDRAVAAGRDDQRGALLDRRARELRGMAALLADLRRAGQTDRAQLALDLVAHRAGVPAPGKDSE